MTVPSWWQEYRGWRDPRYLLGYVTAVAQAVYNARCADMPLQLRTAFEHSLDLARRGKFHKAVMASRGPYS